MQAIRSELRNRPGSIIASLSVSMLAIGLCLYAVFSAGSGEQGRHTAERSVHVMSVDRKAADGSEADASDLSQKVMALFEDNCYACHGSKRQWGGLRIDLKRLAFRGGDSAEPGIVPGNSDKSYIFQSLTGANGVTQMPKDGEPLSDEQVALVKRWIDAGAPWPQQAGADEADAESDATHWSLQPVADPRVPQTRSAAWLRSG